MNVKLTHVGAVVLLAALVFGGCASPPPNPGSRGGRIDPYRTTDADRMSESVIMPALLEACDETAANLVQDLNKISEISGAQAERQVVLEIGDIHNQTRTAQGDFEMMMIRLRDQLMGSDVMNKHVMFVESGERMNQLRRQITAQDGATNVYHPEDTYVLLGDFYQSSSATRRYYFSLRLVNLQSKTIVFRHQYDLALN